MPPGSPVMMIGPLADHQRFQDRGIGRGLVRDAAPRTLQASEIAGIRAILVHAISEHARNFYVECGFVASPVDPMTLMITVAEAAKSFIAR